MLVATLEANLAPTSTPDASGFTVGGFDGVRVIPLASPDSDRPLWAAFTYGMRSFDPLTNHFVTVYTYSGGMWQELDYFELTCADYLSPDSVTQVLVEPTNTWLEVSSSAGAHAGCYDLLSFDGRHLHSEVSASSPSPGAAWLQDLNGDGILEAVLDASDPYVFCYACSVRDVAYTVLHWNGHTFVPVSLQRLPETVPPSLRQANDRAVALAEAGLWPLVTASLQPVVAAAPDNDVVAWNNSIVQLNINGWQRALPDSGYPLLSYVMYGDFRAAVDLIAAYPVDTVYGAASPLVSGTTAEGWEQELAQQVIAGADRALAVEPRLADAYFLRAWATYLTDPTSETLWDDLAEAARLAPDRPFFGEALRYLQNQAGVNSSTPPPVAGQEWIVDNTAPGFSTHGEWYVGYAPDSYGEDYAWAARSVENTTTWTSDLPAAGMYEVFLWWCADTEHGHSDRVRLTIAAGDGEHTVWVDQQRDASRWVSLGRYFLPAGSLSRVTLHADFDGNVVADAVRFVSAPVDSSPVSPTPVPMPTVIVTNYPPTPAQQLSSGDLSRRLLLTGNAFYQYTPLVNQEQVTFDDCRDFPGPGCIGQRPGWLITTRYLAQAGGLTVTYRIAEDYSLSLLETGEALRDRQRLFMEGMAADGRRFEVDRSPGGSWRLFILEPDEAADSEVTLPDATLTPLQSLVDSYNTVSLAVDGQGWRLYGLGSLARLAPDDEGLLRGLVYQMLELGAQ